MPTRQLSAKEVLKDIRAGMDDAALREKYKLSDKGLRSLFNKLVETGLLNRSALARRASGPDMATDMKEEGAPQEKIPSQGPQEPPEPDMSPRPAPVPGAVPEGQACKDAFDAGKLLM